MKILIWTGSHDLLDGAIKFLTHGSGSHAAFLRADGETVHEAFYPRVRNRPLTNGDAANVQCFALQGVTPEQDADFEKVFDLHILEGVEYSIGDLFRYAFNVPSDDEKHTFCSRYVMHCIQSVLPEELWPLVRLPAKDWAAPRDLLISPRLIEVGI